nr:uncharacterized protein LOC123478127 [Desmodus rotundus]
MAGPGLSRAGSAPTDSFRLPEVHAHFQSRAAASRTGDPPPPRLPPSLAGVGLVKVPSALRSAIWRRAGCPLLARHAEPNPDRKAEQTPEWLGPRPPPSPPPLERRPSPNFLAATPLASRPTHEYLYREDSVSAYGPSHQSQGTGRRLCDPKAQPSLRQSERQYRLASCLASCLRLENFGNLGKGSYQMEVLIAVSAVTKPSWK